MGEHTAGGTQDAAEVTDEVPDPLVDLSVLQALRSRMGERGPAMLEKLLTTWESETERRLVDIDEAVAAGDAEALGRAAHAIKGGSGTLGAFGLAAVCAEVEAPIRAGQPVDLVQDRARIRAAVEIARQGLGQLRVGSAG